ncbi:MAG: ribose-phosphate pyrophosphokinase [Oscillospiraceae bacterium]|nr:ribose-phosphate pyrophosphokinase [Oscillospiraceae bacterium]
MPEINLEKAVENSIPVGKLGILALTGTDKLAKKIDFYLRKWRAELCAAKRDNPHYDGYAQESYQIKYKIYPFGSGERKFVLEQSVRGYDVYILCDVFNYGETYEMYGYKNRMCPDMHFADLKRAISAIAGKARRINVIMPMLYEGRQDKRTMRESLDCAQALQEMAAMGVENIVTFDAHNASVQNAIPLKGFENVRTTYQMIKALCRAEPNLIIDKDNLVIIAPDAGAMGRCAYYAKALGADIGMFYKQRDYALVEDGRNKITEHEYLGAPLDGKSAIVVDDMIASGDSMLKVAQNLKEKQGAEKIFLFSAFGLFTSGLKRFDDACEKGWINRVFTTNTVYRPPELLRRKWYKQVDMSKYIAYLLNNLNHDQTLSILLNPSAKIEELLHKHNERLEQDRFDLFTLARKESDE